jgi:hypothetical protein
MGQIKGTLNKAYKEDRLTFADERVEYTDKEGETHKLTLDELASYFWDKFNSQLIGGTGMASSNLSAVEIAPEDIKAVLLEIKDKGRAK